MSNLPFKDLTDPALDSAFWTPSRIGFMSAWWGHVPFGHWLVSTLRPNTVVELGAHNGVSFSAFCEAMQRARCPGRCYAVDTWEGDEQAGHYGEEVFQSLSAFVNARYGSFAELMRMRFDQASAYFLDGSIDLLHIDGLHTYEAVKHDFDTWLPKLSSRGVVIFHDTNVRERDFGVWRLWSELRERYPTFEFLHAHGLGVALIGDQVAPALAELCSSSSDVTSAIRDRFAQLGSRWVVGEHASQLEQHARNLEAEREVLSRSLEDYKSHASGLESQRSTLEQVVARHSAEIEAGKLQRESAIRDLEAARVELAARSERLSVAGQRLASAERTRTTLAEQLAAQDIPHAALAERLRHRVDALVAQHAATVGAMSDVAADQEANIRRRDQWIQELYTSTSWRVTRPLRAVRKVSRLLLHGEPMSGMPALAPVQAGPEPEGNQAAPSEITTPVDPGTASSMEVIANSGLFDEAGYAGAEAARAMSLHPIAHYLEAGEAAGLAPSPLFDPVFYKARYPDVVGQVPNVLMHYIENGRREGRETLPIAATLNLPYSGIRHERSTVVVIVHEATRTGAPILAWNIVRELKTIGYNVIVLLRTGGPISEAFEDVSDGVVALPQGFIVHDAQVDALTQSVCRRYAPLYVIANSVESRYFVPAFERAGVPVLALVHEFSSTVRPPGSLHGLFDTASEVVFSARIVADGAVADYATLRARQFRVLPQGASALPPSGPTALSTQRKIAIKDTTSLPDDDDAVLVIGVGTITMRKGVEMFVAAASRVHREDAGRRIKFLWIGDAYWFDEAYFDFVREQVRRSGIEASFGFAGELGDLSNVYERADILFLSSRLDPLPNVMIDASLHGVPVVCFDQASGCAELLQTSEATRDLVVPYMDTEAAARLILDLAADRTRLTSLGEGMRALGERFFNMTRYVQQLDQYGREAKRARKERARDAATLADSSAFNAALYRGAHEVAMSRPEAVAHYLHASHLAIPRGREETGRLVRRPLEGFHPLVYASACAAFDETLGEDPLAHYVRTGRPDGPWKHPVIRGDAPPPGTASHLRIVVHAHFHYPELFEDFVIRLRRNEVAPDVLVTTTSAERADAIKASIEKLEVARTTVFVTPNRGRDIAPMLTRFGKDHFANYDLVGHFHGKRSPHADGGIGELWRNFIWEHLLGGERPMMDAIVAAMNEDETLGLVFPEDPHLPGWDENRSLAEGLAARIGLPRPLPNHFDFPIGTMFWARSAALGPLQALEIDWDDFPPEPLPIDGSMLHALERLLPFSARHAGYRYATTIVDGSVR